MQNRNGKRREKDPAVAYINKSKKGLKYISMLVNAEALSKLEATNGVIKLTGFFQLEKSSEKAPDIVFKPSTTGQASTARTKKVETTEDDFDLPI